MTTKLRLATLLVTWFGAGNMPKAKGTSGSIATLPFAFAIHYFFGNFALMGFAFFIFFLGWYASDIYLKAHPEKDDPGEIVIDEVAGQSLVLSLLFPTWQSYLVGLFLFRLFDVVKPWPVSWADTKIKGALGVMFDDMLAAFYPVVIMAIILLEANMFGVQDALTGVFAFLGDVHVSTPAP